MSASSSGARPGLPADTIAALAEHLERCQLEQRDTVKITDAHPDMTWDDAYAIQETILQRKLARGAKVVGYKAGLTSRAKMDQMGVDSPVFGFLVGDYEVPADGRVPTAELIHPRVEPEICFMLKSELRGPDCTVEAVLDATDYVMPGMEVIDSRYRDFKFDLKSVVADNTSAARYVLGRDGAPARSLDLPSLRVVLEKNGEPVAVGTGAAVLDNPAQAVAMLVNHLAARGKTLPAGSIVLSGGVTEAVAVNAGDQLTLHVEGLGRASMRFA